MKVNLKAKYLQYFCKQVSNQGFSSVSFFIFLLFVCSIVPLALYIYVEHDIASQETEGKTYVGSMNRAQQAYYLENNNFTHCLESLGLGIQPDTKNYSYRSAIGVPLGKNRYRFVLPSSPKKSCPPPKEELTIPFDQPPPVVMNTAISKNPKLKTYVGLLFPGITYGTNHRTIIFVCESTVYAVLWESKKPSTPPPEIWLRPPEITGHCGGGKPDTFISPSEGFQEVPPKVKQNNDFWPLRLPWF
ncbi:MAG: type IV pilin-like G/H family protein [Potamolinea sp.]